MFDSESGLYFPIPGTDQYAELEDYFHSATGVGREHSYYPLPYYNARFYGSAEDGEQNDTH